MPQLAHKHVEGGKVLLRPFCALPIVDKSFEGCCISGVVEFAVCIVLALLIVALIVLGVSIEHVLHYQL